MRFAALTAALAIALGPAGAAEPRAALSGPESVAVRGIVRLDPGGSVADRVMVRLWRGPAAIAPEPLFDRGGKVICFEAVPTKPGTYEFVAIAMGNPPPGAPATAEPAFDFAFWSVQVPAPQPVPQPAPPPSPQPPPQPQPIPADPPTRAIPASEPLIAVLVYDRNAQDQLIAVRGDESLGPALAALGVTWIAIDFADPALASMRLGPWVGPRGPPVLVCYGGSSVYDAAGVPVDQAAPARARIVPPRTAAEMVALFRRLRGQQ